MGHIRVTTIIMVLTMEQAETTATVMVLEKGVIHVDIGAKIATDMIEIEIIEKGGNLATGDVDNETKRT